MSRTKEERLYDVWKEYEKKCDEIRDEEEGAGR